MYWYLGPEALGKSTLLKKIYDEHKRLYIDLLLTDTETRFSRNPDELVNIVEALPETITHIIIDEIQKIPKLLDVVHLLIEKKKKYFVLSGSSARKLKRGAANLLAGRAFVYHLHAFSFLELEKPLDLQQALDFGICEAVCFSNDPYPKHMGNITVLPWRDGIKKYFQK